ncbi:penicillin-binding protein 2 [Selenihalanaerobacter shriftii]|uniref:Penicillin-binding protein 2 n=1 Tax=Selenihalanaerobacter shriftii TaxID=142842 RepID=A0A1T4PPV8_9FIRM|nr:penicillin-binding protein 2 [Selenihalanaerobacter shriftii]SJZ92918.1 penicillin-binding protein 2 [Selenihalanaerobacter shriftii]
MGVENKFNQRVKYFGIIIIILFVTLIGRSFYLQIILGNKYQKLANGNRIDIRDIQAPRGKIKTKDGRVLVSNRLAYTVSIIPEKAQEELTLTLKKLGEILKVKPTKLRDKIEKKGNHKSVVLKRDISQEELVIIEESKSELPGVIIDKLPVRDYVYGHFASHMLGYVGEISASQLKEYEQFGYETNDIVGKTGLELEYERYLQGKDGRKQIEVNNLGQKIRVLGVEQPISGDDLVLNIDFKLQKIVEKNLKNELKKLRQKAKDKNSEESQGLPTGGAVVALNPNNGKVLALASAPDYNLSLFSGGISIKKWEELNTNSLRPLFNRAIKSAPPSGSIFKLVTGTAAIEELGITANSQFYDPGYYKVGGIRFNNWLTGGQGNLDFIDAIAFSNNTVFYKLGHRLYKTDKVLLQKYARNYGLGQKTGIDLPNEASGLVPDPTWREKIFSKRINQIWFPGYTINLSIGQGNLKTTPVQLVNLVSAVANGGTIYSPQIVDKVINNQGKVVKNFKSQILNKLNIEKKTFEILQEGMVGVTNYGTAAYMFKKLPFKVAGKTGTAQTGGNRNNHAWFAGYAPADNPQVAIVVFLEHGNSSSNTLPIAKRILESYLISKAKPAKNSQ